MQLPALETVSLALVFGTSCYALARRLKLPAILFYLLTGLAVGPMGLGWVDTAHLGDGLIILVEFAVAIILFEGGLSLSHQGFLAAPTAIKRLLSVTIAMNLLGGAVLAHYLLGLSWHISTLFGAIMVVTGPTVIGPLLKSVRLTHRLESLLLWESIWGDVLGVLLAATALEFIKLASTAEVLGVSLGLSFVLSIAIGISVGVVGGLFLNRILLPWTERLADHSLPGVVAFAAAPGLFVLANSLGESSGPLAVAVAGYFLSRQRGETLYSIRQFKDQLAIIFISALFILLSASIDLKLILELWPRLLLLTALMALVVRPLGVHAALAGTCATTGERWYAALIGPRGIIALATAAYAALTTNGMKDEMQVLLASIFTVVFLTGALATILGRPMARWFRVKMPRTACGIIFLGANRLTLALAEFVEEFVPVVFLDTRSGACQSIRSQGRQALCSKGLDDDLFEIANSEGFCRLLALTGDDSLNELVAEKALRHLGTKQVFRAKPDRQENALLTEMEAGRYAFSEEFNLAEAIQRLDNGTARIELYQDFEPEDYKGKAIPLIEVLPQGQGVRIVTGDAGFMEHVLALTLLDGSNTTESKADQNK